MKKSYLLVLVPFLFLSLHCTEYKDRSENVIFEMFNDSTVKEVNIAFLGGSITEGAGAKGYANCYAVQLEHLLEAKYNKEVNVLNFGIGATTSELGMYRVRSLLDAKPDLVIVEFAVNDLVIDSLSATYNHENIFRQVLERKIPVISLNLNTKNSKTAYETIKVVGDRFHVTDVRVKLEENEFSDDVHPNDVGHLKIAKTVLDIIETNPKALSYDIYNCPPALVGYDFDQANFFMPDLSVLGWERGDNVSRLDHVQFYDSQEVDTINFKFTGNRIWFVTRKANIEEKKNSTFLIRLDSLPVQEFKLYNNPAYIITKPYLLAEKLPEGEHTLQLITKPTDASKVAHHEIIDFLISGKGEVGIELVK